MLFCDVMPKATCWLLARKPALPLKVLLVTLMFESIEPEFSAMPMTFPLAAGVVTVMSLLSMRRLFHAPEPSKLKLSMPKLPDVVPPLPVMLIVLPRIVWLGLGPRMMPPFSAPGLAFGTVIVLLMRCVPA